MKKVFCDRCGSEIEDGTKHWLRVREVYRNIIFFTPVGMSRTVEAPKEICQECMSSFYDWWSVPDYQEGSDEHGAD